MIVGAHGARARIRTVYAKARACMGAVVGHCGRRRGAATRLILWQLARLWHTRWTWIPRRRPTMHICAADAYRNDHGYSRILIRLGLRPLFKRDRQSRSRSIDRRSRRRCLQLHELLGRAGAPADPDPCMHSAAPCMMAAPRAPCVWTVLHSLCMRML